MSLCEDCYGLGVVTDPEYARLVVARLYSPNDTAAVDARIETMRKASNKTGRYWMVKDCDHKGSGQ